MTLRNDLKKCVWVAAITFGIGMAGGGARAIASPAPQEHHDDMQTEHQNNDYSKNKNYQLGMQDGRNDQMHNRDHYKKRHFKKDDDHNAYEAGYQAAHNSGHEDHH